MSHSTNNALPQGFSVFQPSVGAQLQFFPALGSQELDDMLNAYLPSNASIQDKRASIAIDFFEHTQLTGQSFKFYPVFSAPSASPSPTTSVASSFNVSPVNQNWDFSQMSRTGSVSSRSSTHRVSKPVAPRQRTGDFSSLPGMKIMTKDGLDVTNAASRGSKTKEQRDHAHLMRIIKACDSCRKKKIRCDPSHKKRMAAQAAAHAAAPASAKAKASLSPSPSPQQPQPRPAPFMEKLVLLDDAVLEDMAVEFDASFDLEALGAVDAVDSMWDEFVQFPTADFNVEYGLFANPESYVSSQSSQSSQQSSSGAVSTSVSPASTQSAMDVGGTIAQGGDVAFASFLEDTASAGSYPDYTDFNLYSPGSTFSEDDRMLDIASSASGQSSVSQSPANVASYDGLGEAFGVEGGAPRGAVEGATLFSSGPKTDGGALGQDHDRLKSAYDQNAPEAPGAGDFALAGHDGVSFSANSAGELVICCPPGTAVVASSNGSATGRDNVRTTVPRQIATVKLTVIQVSSTNIAPTPVSSAYPMTVRNFASASRSHTLTVAQETYIDSSASISVNGSSPPIEEAGIASVSTRVDSSPGTDLSAFGGRGINVAAVATVDPMSLSISSGSSVAPGAVSLADTASSTLLLQTIPEPDAGIGSGDGTAGPVDNGGATASAGSGSGSGTAVFGETAGAAGATGAAGACCPVCAGASAAQYSVSCSALERLTAQSHCAQHGGKSVISSASEGGLLATLTAAQQQTMAQAMSLLVTGIVANYAGAMLPQGDACKSQTEQSETCDVVWSARAAVTVI